MTANASLRRIVCTALALGATIPASAHHFWLHASRYDIPRLAVSRGGNPPKPDTVLLFGYGDIYPLQDLLAPESVRTFELVAADRERRPIALKPGPFLATPINFPSVGSYIAAAALHPQHVTQVGEPKQHRYLLVPRDEVPAGTPIVRSLYYHNYGKALVHAGTDALDSPQALASTPVGHPLEIVLHSDPRQARTTGGCGFTVLFEGKPLRDRKARVRATHVGYSTTAGAYAWQGELTDEGLSLLPSPRPGVWQIHVSHETPPPEQMKGKADYVLYSATFTFEIPDSIPVGDEESP